MAGERKRCYEDPKNKGKKPDQRDGLGGRAGDVHCVSLSEKTVDAVHDRLCHSALLPAWDLRSGGGQKEQECILDPSHYPCDRCCDTADIRAGFGRIDAAFGTERYHVFAFGTK